MKKVILIVCIVAYTMAFLSIGIAYDDDAPRPKSNPQTTETSFL